MARQPPELTEQQRLLGRYLAALRNVAHVEAGSQLPDSHFWETADRVVGANGALIARYDALIQEAYGHYYTGDLPEAVQVAQHAQTLSGQIPSVGAVLAAALEARAQAALGHRNETRVALGYAETCLSHLDAGAIGTSAFNYNEAQLRFHESNSFTHLHDTNAAWRAQEVVLTLCPASDYMDRTMTKLDRANCLVHDGDVTGAVAIMVEAATSLTDQRRQGIIASRVRESRKKLIVVEIRPAAHSDIEAIALLMEDLDCFYGATDIEPPSKRVSQIAAALFREPRAAYALLACEGERLVGMAVYSFLWPAAGVTRSLYLKELYIAETVRGKGIGTLLMQRLCQVAVEHACSRVEWTTDKGNALGESFYERRGAPKNQDKIFYRLEGADIRRAFRHSP